MRQKGIVQLFLLLIVIVAAIGAVGYLAYQKAQLRTQEDGKATTSESTGSRTTDNWNIYSNQEGGFSLKYPNDLYYVVDLNKPINTPQENRTQLRFYDKPSEAQNCKEQLEEHTNCTFREKIGINTQIYPMSESLDEELEKFALTKTNSIVEYAGVRWNLVSGGTTGSTVGHTAWSVRRDKLIMLDFWQFPENQNKYNTYNPLKNELSNQILSTFKFTE